MAKQYTYTLTKTGKVIYKSVEANYVSKETVDLKVKAETGHDPRLDRHLIDCKIVTVNDSQEKPKIGHYDKNKKTTGFH